MSERKALGNPFFKPRGQGSGPAASQVLVNKLVAKDP
jgi:hypothetical protein